MVRRNIKDRWKTICNDPIVRGKLSHLGIKENLNGWDRSGHAENS